MVGVKLYVEMSVLSMNHFINLFNFIGEIAYSLVWPILNIVLFLFALAGLALYFLKGKFKQFILLWGSVIAYQVFVVVATVVMGIPSMEYTIIFGLVMPFLCAGFISLKYFAHGLSAKEIIKRNLIVWFSYILVGFFVLSISAIIWGTI